jgi:hypothetical protein
MGVVGIDYFPAYNSCDASNVEHSKLRCVF